MPFSEEVIVINVEFRQVMIPLHTRERSNVVVVQIYA